MNEQRLLVLALAPFGDALQAIEPLAARRRARPDERVTLAAPPGACDVIGALGLTDESWDVGPTPREAGPIRVYRAGVLLVRARRGHFDEVVDLFPHLRTVAAARLAMARRSRSDAAFIEAAFRIRAKVQGGYDPRERIARLLDVDPERRETLVDFAVDRESDAWIERALAATGFRGGEPVVVAHAAGAWPADRFVGVAERLRSALGARVVFVDTPREGGDAKVLAARLGGSVLGVAAPTAGRYLAAIARASVVLTDEPGTAHVAGFLKVPTLLVANEGRPTSAPAAGCSTLDAPDVASIGVDAAFDAACKLVRRSRTGSLFE